MGHKSRRILGEAFGRNEFGLPDLPTKVSNVRVARLVFCRMRGGCSYCFPHGLETTNNRRDKNRRSWKYYRAHQYREENTARRSPADIHPPLMI